MRLKRGFSFGGWLPHIAPIDPNEFQAPFPSEGSDEYYMFQAFLAGMENGAMANPNPSVGCVIVKNGRILARGCTQAWGDSHAERMAFNQVSREDLKGASVYATLEPCTHQGRQPPCVDLFRDSGIQKVFIARRDPNPLVTAHEGVEALRSFGIEVREGLLANETTAWNYPFFIQQRFNRPMVALKWAQSLDGCLADDNNGWQWISGSTARQYAHWLRQKYDAVLVGAGTVLNDFPSLTVRDIPLSTKRNPLKIVFDPNGRTLTCSKEQQSLLKQKTFCEGSKTLLLIDEHVLERSLPHSQEWNGEICNSNEVKILPLKKQDSSGYSASEILGYLSKTSIKDFLGRPLQSILVEGGPRLLTMFVQEELFDVAHTMTAPFVLGGSKNRLFTNGYKKFITPPTREVSLVTRWHMAAQIGLGNDVLIEMLPAKRLEEHIFELSF